MQLKILYGVKKKKKEVAFVEVVQLANLPRYKNLQETKLPVPLFCFLSLIV